MIIMIQIIIIIMTQILIIIEVTIMMRKRSLSKTIFFFNSKTFVFLTPKVKKLNLLLLFRKKIASFEKDKGIFQRIFRIIPYLRHERFSVHVKKSDHMNFKPLPL